MDRRPDGPTTRQEHPPGSIMNPMNSTRTTDGRKPMRIGNRSPRWNHWFRLSGGGRRSGPVGSTSRRGDHCERPVPVDGTTRSTLDPPTRTMASVSALRAGPLPTAAPPPPPSLLACARHWVPLWQGWLRTTGNHWSWWWNGRPGSDLAPNRSQLAGALPMWSAHTAVALVSTVSCLA